MLYTSIDNKKIKDIKKLNTKKYRDKTGLFLVEGEHLVLEAYKTGNLVELLLEENQIFPLDIETNYISNNVLNYISELDTPQKIIGICKKNNTKELGSKILILDDIQDPGNLGTIIRNNLIDVLNNLKKDNYYIYGTKVTHGNNLKSLEKKEKFAIIMGNEGNGMHEEVAELCDKFIYIEMNDVVESLNVGVATSIILYEFSK